MDEAFVPEDERSHEEIENLLEQSGVDALEGKKPGAQGRVSKLVVVNGTTVRVVLTDGDGNYAPYTDCSWLVTSTDEDSLRLWVEILYLSVDESSGCSRDFVALHDGADEGAGELVARGHGAQSLPPQSRATPP